MKRLVCLLGWFVLTAIPVPGSLREARADDTISFAAAVSYGVGAYPRSTAAGDFDGDGTLDLAATNGDGNNISVLLGDGLGGFAAAGSYGEVDNPWIIIAADFNRDGKLDLAAASIDADCVSVLLGNGDGSFRAAVNYAAGNQVYSVTAADLNGDGIPDLVTADYLGNGISVLLGNGDGTFWTAVSYATGVKASSVTAADFNRDGRKDLAVTNWGNNNVSILLGNGDGTFQTAVNYAVGGNPLSVTAADFNGDDRLDLATANPGTEDVSVLLGNGDGTFQTAAGYASDDWPYSVVAADFNGDGKVDLAAANVYGDDVKVLAGNGDGTFQAAVGYPTGSMPFGVTEGDFNRDGKPDLAAANAGSDSVSILLNTTTTNSSGTFAQAANYYAGPRPDSVISEDFNRDGKLDLAVADYGGGVVCILPGTGDGTFDEAVFLTKPGFGVESGPISLAAGDFNRDGKMDVAAADYVGAAVSVLLGNGDNTFQTSASYSAGSNPRCVIAADFNRDGILDLAAANMSSGNVSVFLGNSSGTFQGAVNLDVSDYPSSLAAGDFNRDGKVDLAVTRYYANIVVILLGDGTGGFQAPVGYGTGIYPASVISADLNRDGIPDLVTANQSDGDVSVLLGVGDGSFQAAVGYPSNEWASQVIAADLDRDGNLDLAVANWSAGNVSILPGNGDGSFRATSDYATGAYAASVTAGDFNRDGKTDLVTANYGSVDLTGVSEGNNVSVLLNSPQTPGVPDISVSPDSHDFGQVTAGTNSDPLIITVTNNGNADLVVGTITLDGDSAAEFAIRNDHASGATIPPAENRTLEVIFCPASAGDKGVTIDIPSNDPDGPGAPNEEAAAGGKTVFPPATVTLVGKGVAPKADKVYGGGGCFIATAAFGSYQEGHVWILRLFRDRFLLTNRPGKAFVRFYYRHSPPLAGWIAGREWARAITRAALLPLYGVAYLLVKGLGWALAGLGTALALIAGRRLPRQSRMAAGLFLFLLLPAAPLSASDFNVNANHLTPALGEPALITTHTAAVLPKGKWEMGLLFSYARDPLEAEIGGEKIALSKDQSLLSLGLARGVTDRFQLGFSIPCLLSQGSDLHRVDDSGVGDLRLEGKYRFCGGKDRVGFAAIPFLTLPSGNTDAFFGAGTAAGGLLLAVDRNWCNHTNLAFNLGWQTQDEEKVPGLKIRNALLFGAGITRRLSNERTNLSLEIAGRADGTSWFSDEDATPIEAVGSITQKTGDRSALTFGLGAALNRGYGAPDFRVLAGYRAMF